MASGIFITVEGVDGAGKSTQLVFLEEFLRDRGLEVLVTREPGGTSLGEAVRELLIGENEIAVTDDVELMLIFTARLQHLEEVIVPAVAAGICVVCDRFTDATYAYQGGGRGISVTRIRQLEAWVQQGFQPDLTLVFDLPVDTGAARSRKRGESADRFERQDSAFKEAVRNTYLDRVHQYPERMRLIDASRGKEQVTENMISIVEGFLKSRENGSVEGDSPN